MKRNSIVVIFINLIFFTHAYAQNSNYYKQSANHKIDRSGVPFQSSDTVQLKNTRPGNYKNNFNHDQYIHVERNDSTSVKNKSATPSSRNYKHPF